MKNNKQQNKKKKQQYVIHFLFQQRPQHLQTKG